MSKLANGYARNNLLRIGKKNLKTPTMFFGQPVNGTPNPWEHFDVDGILLNAFHILEKQNELRKIKECKSLTKYLNAKPKTSIMIDSGGFLFQKKEIMDVDCKEILRLYNEIKPDIGVVLDHPFSPLNSAADNYNKRWKRTIKNTKIMLSEKNNIIIFPVVHGYNTDQIEKHWKDIKHILEETGVFENRRMIIGIGSLVPLMMTSAGVKNGKNLIVDLVIKLRKLVPNAHMHAFGIGGATTALIMYYLGVDSLDSVSWRLKAAKGALQLPGVSDRFIVPPKGRQKLSQSNENKLEQCLCPNCKNKSLNERKFLLGPNSPKNFENRAIHNAWVYQSEIEECRKAIKQNRFEIFIRNRLENSSMKSMFRYAVDKLSTTKLDDFNK